MATDYQTYVNTITAAADRFTRDTTDHVMTVLRDDDLYRHLRFRRPDTGMYWFDLVTWPGYLTITGDFGTGYTFARLDDMFEFFRGKDINPHYWAEKITSGQQGVTTYSEKRFREYVDEHVAAAIADRPELGVVVDDQKGLTGEVEEALSNWYNADHIEGAREFLDNFAYAYSDADQILTWRFEDTWEWDLTDWGWSYLWACHAIQWGIGQYDAAKVATR